MRILLFVLLITHYSVNSQNTEVSDVEALELLENIHTEYQSYDTHRFVFDMTVKYPEKEGDSYSGTLIQGGDKFSLDMEDRQIISDTETIWVFHKNRNEVELNDADFGEDSGILTPSDIFQLYKSDKYLFAIGNYVTVNGHSGTEIECKPLDRNSEYSKIRLVVSQKTKSMASAILFYKDGSRLTMDLKEHNKGYTVTDAHFTFDASLHPGVTIEDLRF
jgi:outer membrane lipoprotein-sorting protein